MAEIRRWVHLGVYNWSPLLFSHPGQPGNSLYPHLLKSAEVYSLGKLNQWGLKHGTMNMGTDISECLIEHGIGLSYFWALGLECHNIHFPLHSYYQECHLRGGILFQFLPVDLWLFWNNVWLIWECLYLFLPWLHAFVNWINGRAFYYCIFKTFLLWTLKNILLHEI